MEIIQANGIKKGTFEARDKNELVGEMTYIWSSRTNIIIDHTEVDADYQGLGVGKEMVEKAVEFARENNITILPLCSFARSIFNKNDSYNDVRKF